jgi:hypothetical protein
MTTEISLAIEHYILFAKKGRTGLSNGYLLMKNLGMWINSLISMLLGWGKRALFLQHFYDCVLFIVLALIIRTAKTKY